MERDLRKGHRATFVNSSPRVGKLFERGHIFIQIVSLTNNLRLHYTFSVLFLRHS